MIWRPWCCLRPTWGRALKGCPHREAVITAGFQRVVALTKNRSRAFWISARPSDGSTTSSPRSKCQRNSQRKPPAATSPSTICSLKLCCRTQVGSGAGQTGHGQAASGRKLLISVASALKALALDQADAVLHLLQHLIQQRMFPALEVAEHVANRALLALFALVPGAPMPMRSLAKASPPRWAIGCAGRCAPCPPLSLSRSRPRGRSMSSTITSSCSGVQPNQSRLARIARPLSFIKV